jgi:hypothetical protein
MISLPLTFEQTQAPDHNRMIMCFAIRCLKINWQAVPQNPSQCRFFGGADSDLRPALTEEISFLK